MAHSTGSENPKTKRKVCGQCENKAALLVCLECGEDYCSGCFAKMHQKGALKFHRTTLLQPKSQILSNILIAAHQFIKEENPPNEGNHPAEASSKSQQKPKALLQNSSEVGATASEGGEGENPRCKVMWEMPFDEEASAQSFREALTQWRAGHQEENKEEEVHAKKPDSVEECEVQTNLKMWTEPINIEFTEDSLSYMETLWLKKYRRTPQEQLRTMLPNTFTHPHQATAEAQCTQNENESDSDVEEIKIKSPPLFMPVEKLNIERPPPSLTIVELDDFQKVTIRKKLIKERYQGPKKFYSVDKNERLDVFPSSSIKGSHSCSEITSTVSEDKMWIPLSSLSGYAGSADALCDQQSDENPLPNMQQQKSGQKSQRPSTANIPISNPDQKDTSCLLFSYTRSKSAAAQMPSRAASEISEIEYIDVTDQSELFGGNTADRQALDTLEKELNILRKPADPSEDPHSLPSEELQAFNDNFLTLSQMSKDLLEMSRESDPHGAESSSSGRNPEIQPLLSLGDYSTDEEEDEFLDKQHVIKLPWEKRA
ncbi:cDNA sequence BC050789, isoform CRA_c [Mus musculus]|nr:cDNA sequence BC050789, isoform CRA_c [Mus musculus]